MAVHRESPICPDCGKEIDAINQNRGKSFIGDTFEGWDYSGHKCKKNTKKKKDVPQYPTIEEEVQIYRNLLISLHTARWTGNSKIFAEILDKIGAYSYARTNSNGYEDEEERIRIQTLLALK